MSFQQREVGDVVVLALSGNFVGGPEATSLYDRLHELVDQGKTRVVIDLAGVEFMNSSGLGILIGGLTTLRNHGGDLKLARAADRVKTLLTLSRIDSVVDVFDDVETAIASFQ